MNIRKKYSFLKPRFLPATQMDNKIINLYLCRLDTTIIQKTGKTHVLNNENLNRFYF